MYEHRTWMSKTKEGTKDWRGKWRDRHFVKEEEEDEKAEEEEGKEEEDEEEDAEGVEKSDDKKGK